jgi:FMN phosphatase YigB (HAD superfamily)
VRYGAVFFDAGETLVHPAPSFPQLFSSILREGGHERDPEEVVAASKVVTERFSEAARNNELWTTSPERSRAFWLDVYDRMLSALDVPGGNGMRDSLYRGFRDIGNYTLFDDVRPTLASLDPHAVLGVVSNFEAWLMDLLEALDIADQLPVRAISGIEGIEKPDARLYELALERAGVDASATVFVGDNPEFDISPPASLGMFPVLIDRRGRHPDHAGPRIVDLEDLVELLERS